MACKGSGVQSSSAPPKISDKEIFGGTQASVARSFALIENEAKEAEQRAECILLPLMEIKVDTVLM